MPKTSVQNFFKSYDRYSKNVSLSYQRKGSFETSIGGFCSIFTFIWMSYWLILNLLETFIPPGSFTTKQNTQQQVINDDGTFALVEIPQEQLFVAYKIMSLSGDVKEEDISSYVHGMWFQQTGTEPPVPYKPVPCLEAPGL